MTPFGLDIGVSTIKAVHLEKKGEVFSLLAAGITASPIPGLASKNEKDMIMVSDAVKRLLSDTKIASKDVNLSIPEQQVFTRLIQLPLLTDEEVASAISWQAEPFIPIPVSEASVDYQIVSRKEGINGKSGVVDVLLVATPKELIEKYLKFAQFAGLNVSSIESDLLALARAVSPEKQTSVIVDIGSSSTNIAISRSGQLVVSRTVATGGSALTRALATGLLISNTQAEEYKKTYGLNGNLLEGKVKQVLEPAFKLIIEEVKKTLQYYKNEVTTEDQVTVAVASGGTSGMLDAVPYIAQELGLEVILGDPFLKIVKDQKLSSQLESWAPLYGVSVGLAQNI